jgi:hypothetical protein
MFLWCSELHGLDMSRVVWEWLILHLGDTDNIRRQHKSWICIMGIYSTVKQIHHLSHGNLRVDFIQ